MKNKVDADNFSAKLAELQAKYEAEPTGINDLEIGCLYCEFADKLTHKFGDAIKAAPSIDEMIAKGLRAGLLVTNQKGKAVFIGYKALAQYKISGNFHRFAFQHGHSRLAEYETPAQVETVIDMLETALNRRDKKITFPTVNELKSITLEADK